MGKILSFVKQEPVLFLFRKLWRFSAGSRDKVVLFLTLFIFSNLSALIGPFIFSQILNEIQRHGLSEASLSSLILYLYLILGCTFLFWFFHGIGRVVERKNSFFVRARYREYLLQGVLNLGLPWHNERDSGDTIDKVNKATSGLYEFSDTVFIAMEIIVRITGTAIVLYFINPYIGIFVLPFILLSFFILFQFDKRLVGQYKKLNLFDNRISAKVFDALSNVTSVIVLDVRKPIVRNLKEAIYRPKDLYEDNVRVNEAKWFSGSILFDFLVVFPLAFYIIYVFKNNVPVEIGTISALYLYLGQLSYAFFNFGSYYEKVIVNKTSVQNAQSIEESFEEKPVTKMAIPNWEKLHLKNVDFSYEDTEHQIKHINNVSIDIRRGERIALIGESGSGKTTLLKVLHGLYTNAKGSISFDGSSDRETSFSDLELQTMLVPQEPELFSASILENITFGVDYSGEEIREAIKLAQFSDVVEHLPRKLDSTINEKGVNLSGGQKQRLALARALLFARGKEILLMDESTSSVDPTNEAKIYENIFTTFKEKTILASIHKMNLLRYFDHILIFENGSIVDEGTFDELHSHNKTFKEGWETFIKIGNQNDTL